MDSLDPDLLIIGGIVFLLLAIFWYQTGRLFLIGWLVKVLWLPINVICAVLWIFTAFVVNIFFDILRGFVLLVRLLSLTLIALCAFSFYQNSEFAIPLVIVSMVFFYLLKFGVKEERLYRWIFYSPKAKRTPVPKSKHRKLQEDEPKAELLPRPLVRLLVKPQRNFETEAKIINKLDDHLQQLIKRGLKS
jgi:hypothetical protein